MSRVSDYAPIVGDSYVDELRLLAERLEGRSVQNINSTSVGGGVAEILLRMLPLLQDLGVRARWDVIKGNERFFLITKKMHNALHGVPRTVLTGGLGISSSRSTGRTSRSSADKADIVFIHDPQPIALVENKKANGGSWIWRCHIDFTAPLPAVWSFLREFIGAYDAVVFSAPAFSRPLADPAGPGFAVDRPLERQEQGPLRGGGRRRMRRFGLDRKRPIVAQISRFDYLKDPLGVIGAYKLVKEYIDCQLVLAGGGATDDPEGLKVLEEVRAEADKDPDIFVLFLPPRATSRSMPCSGHRP